MREIELPHLGKLHRKNYYSQNAFHHPAKMHPELARWIIEQYSSEGDLILDPMAGIGTTVIEAMLLGRHAIAIEIEPKWARVIHESASKRSGGIMPMGRVQVVLGDSTHAITYDMGQITNPDLIIMSPPYGIDLHGGGIAKEQRPGGLRPYDQIKKNKKNLGNYLLESFEYTSGMQNIYQHAVDITKPGGFMVTVTKNFYYKGELKQLDFETIQLAESVGWSLGEHLKFKLPYDSMWQKMYAKKYPERTPVKHEDILVFEKVRGVIL